MKCVDFKMVAVELEGGVGYPSGRLVQSIASKESLYLVKDGSSSSEAKVHLLDCMCSLLFVWLFQPGKVTLDG